MVEKWIPGAEILSVTVMGVCFIIALIAINMQEAGRSRTVGVLGVLVLLASAVLAAVTRSVVSVYGSSTPFNPVGTVIVGASAAAGLVLLALSLVWAGRRRGAR